MHFLPPSRTARTAFIVAACAVLAAGIAGAGWINSTSAPSSDTKPMLLAPMIGVIEPCVVEQAGMPAVAASLTTACTGPGGSAGALVESTLRDLESSQRAKPLYPVGYTLPIPLLRLFQNGPWGWEIDRAMVRRLVSTVRDVQRPLVVYLFSTHFASDAPIEPELARDANNMAHTRDGPLGMDAYYDSSVYNWTFATADNAITQRRAQAIGAVLEEICRLDAGDRAKIQGVTLLGELHHLFPNFQAGMGFDAPYRITDYSAASVQAFRRYLEREFRSIAQLNRSIGGDYPSFDSVDPPSKDIRTEPLRRFTEHIDSFAHGSLPISGWAYVKDAPPTHLPRIHVYRNGSLMGKTTVHLARQDVLAAMPQFGNANTGWRLDLDFRRLPAGVHRLDIFLESHPGRLAAMGTRHIAIMDRKQGTPLPLPQRSLPHAASSDASFQGHIDFPRDQSSYYYNPLVSLWHAFRAQQVTDYLRVFDAQVKDSCLESVPRYTHQIVPFTNPSWDENKFAIEDSLRPHKGLRLGVSLYGEPTYGASFAHWLARSGQQRYGITEFHPLKAMDAPATSRMLEQHARQGADFLSFFVEPRWEGQRVPRGHNMFSFDPHNPQFGSDSLYRSVQQTLSSAQ